MNDFQEFLAMGGYAKYVWTSYGVAMVVLLVNFVEPIICTRRLRARLTHTIKLKGHRA